MARTDKTEARKTHAIERMRRIMRLRAMGAPFIIIKNEQIAMICNRKGLKGEGNAYADALRNKHIPD